MAKVKQSTLSELRDRILRERGVPLRRKRSEGLVIARQPPKDGRKTQSMLLLEYQYQRPIEELLQGPIRRVARRLGLDYTTISKWKKLLKLWPPGYCPHHKARYDDYCHLCWLEEIERYSAQAGQEQRAAVDAELTYSGGFEHE